MAPECGEGFLVRGDRGAVRAVQGAGRGRLAAERGGGAGAHQLGGGQPGPGLGDDQARGPDRSTGPEVRCPATVMVALSSPNVVSDALHRVRYVSRTAPAGAAWWSSRVVIRVQVFCLPGRGVQPGQAGPIGQPAAAGQRQADPLLHARDDVPARVKDRGDQLMAG